MSNEHNESQVRVFLSVDLVGSTRLKNRLNHQELFDKYGARLSVLNKVREQNETVDFDRDAARTAVLESLGVSTEDFDWATVVEFFYASFHSELAANLKNVKERHNLKPIDEEPHPWKAVGDELIYQFEVRSRLELTGLLSLFSLHCV